LRAEIQAEVSRIGCCGEGRNRSDSFRPDPAERLGRFESQFSILSRKDCN
jgi:hypothetical protein